MHYRVWTGWLRNSPAEKYLDILVDAELNTDQECSLFLEKANYALEFFSVSVVSRFEGTYSPLLGAVKTHMDYYVQIWLRTSRAMLSSWRGSIESLLKWVEVHMSHKEMLRKMGLFSLEKRGLEGQLTATWKCDKGEVHKLLSSVANDKQEIIPSGCTLGGSCWTTGENIYTSSKHCSGTGSEYLDPKGFQDFAR